EVAEKAADYAAGIAGKFNSEVTLLYAYEVSDDLTRLVGKVDKGISHQLEDMENHLKEYGDRILSESEKKFNGVKVNKLMEVGKPGPVITKIAERDKYNLIIMGSRGLGQVKSVLIGSTGNYVIHHTKCPVFIVH